MADDDIESVYPELAQCAARIGVDQYFDVGCIVIEQCVPAPAAYWVFAGHVKLTRIDSDGRESVVDVRGRGSLLGLDSVLLAEPSPVSAVVLRPSRLRCLPRRALDEAIQASPPLVLDLLRIVCRSSINDSVQIARLLSSTAEERAVDFLESLGVRSEGATKVQLPIRDYDLAAYLGVTPPHLSRLLARLQRKGVVVRRGGWFLWADRQKLKNGARP